MSKPVWYHIAKVCNEFGKESLYCNGKLRTYQPEIWFDEIRISNIVRPPYTVEYFLGVGFSIKHWTYAQKWSLAQTMKKYTRD